VLAPRLVSTAFNGVVKGAFDGLKPDSCELVPLPPPSLVAKFTGSEGFAAADATKLKAFDDKWGPTLRALPRTQDGAKICLPSAENLDKLAFAQAKLARAFGGEEAKAFGTYFGGVSKASIVPGKVLPYLLWLYLLLPYLLWINLVWLHRAGQGTAATYYLLHPLTTVHLLYSFLTVSKVLPLIGDAQKQTMGASLKERQRFKAAGKDLETISKTCAALPKKAQCEL
jgi:hypothetical protein